MDADSAAELAALVAPADGELAAAFAGSVLAPRCAALCLLRCWVEQSEQSATWHGSAGTAAAQADAAREAGLLAWRRLLALAATDPELSAARYSPLGHVHRKKVQGAATKRRLRDALCAHGGPCNRQQALLRIYCRACTAQEIAERPACLPAHHMFPSLPPQVRLWQALCTLSPLVPEEQVEAGAAPARAAAARPQLFHAPMRLIAWLWGMLVLREAQRCPCFGPPLTCRL